jgi:hypothetical protein
MNQQNRDLQNSIIDKWLTQKQQAGENYSREHCEKLLLAFKDYPKLVGTAQTYNKKLEIFLNKFKQL